MPPNSAQPLFSRFTEGAWRDDQEFVTDPDPGTPLRHETLVRPHDQGHCDTRRQPKFADRNAVQSRTRRNPHLDEVGRHSLERRGFHLGVTWRRIPANS